MSAPPFLRTAVALALGALLLSGCGTRADDAEIRAGVGAGPVTLDQKSVDALRAVTAGAGGAATTGTPGAGPAGSGAATTGTAPGVAKPSGTTTTSTTPGTAPGTTVPDPATRAGTASTAVGAAACTQRLAPIALGQVGTFSGLAGAVSAAARTTAAVWVQDVNARGGLACHPVTLWARDDGGVPAKAAALVRELYAEQKIVALIASPIVFSVAGFRSAVEDLKLPAVGGELLAPDWNESPYLFAQGAGFFDTIVGFLKQGVELGKKRIATLYCVEVTACSEGIAYGRSVGVKKAGGQLVYDSAISLTQTDFTAQCQNAKNAGADQLVLGMDGSAMTRVARSCAALGYKPLLSGLGGTISLAQSADPNLRSFGLAVASGVAPWTETDTPGLRAYREALARYAPAQQPDGASVQAWTSGKLLEAAINGVAAKARSGAVTSALVLAALGTVKNNDLGGLVAPITFSPNLMSSVSSGCVFYELLTPQGWTAPRGSRKVCV
jgi:branched-chain amino acid transport system substrate-binding protein